MRNFTKRLTKKYCKRVADGLWDDTITPFHAKKVQQLAQRHFDQQYLLVFQPMVYESMEEFDFEKEYKNHNQKALKQFQSITGVHPGMFNSYLKTLPKRKQNRKDRKIKKQDIRKLRNPQDYTIRQRNVDGSIQNIVVTGELAFSHKGYNFFIFRDGDYWNVSDVVAGSRIYCSKVYDKAIQTAKNMIESNIDKYIKEVNKLA